VFENADLIQQTQDRVQLLAFVSTMRNLCFFNKCTVFLKQIYLSSEEHSEVSYFDSITRRKGIKTGSNNFHGCRMISNDALVLSEVLNANT
jgi:hypothetical protein